MKKLPEGSVQTPIFRAAFPFVFKPRPADSPDKKSKYEVVMLFPKDTDLSALKKAVTDMLTAKFGVDKAKWPKGRNPFRDGDEMAHLNGYAGNTFLSAKSTRPVGVVDERCVPIADENGFYPGVYARAIVAPYWYDYNGNKGIGFFLNGLQRMKHGERLVNAPKPEEMFQAVEGAAEDDGF
jgi:hypothetical protein